MKHSSEVRDAFASYLEAIGRGDVAAIERILSNESGLRVIGTDPREWWSGRNDVVRLFKTQLSELGEFAFKLDAPEVYEEGSTGWAAGKFTADIAGNQIAGRISTVFHQENGKWKVVQSHASIGAANEDELGRELTTE